MNSADRTTFRLARLVGRGRSVAVLLTGLLLGCLIIAFAPAGDEGTGAGSNLPRDAESVFAGARLAELRGGDKTPAIIVYSRSDGLAPTDLRAVTERAEAIADEFGVKVVGPVPSDDRSVALLTVPVDSDLSNEENSALVDRLRSLSRANIPSGVTAQVTGGPAIQADLGDVFAGADVKLLIVTASVVALLLIVTYRSPWLWIVPLSIIGLADRVAAKVIDAISAWTDFTVDGSITGITSVLVFGAGTNYALLLIARYREELRHAESRHEAMQRAVGGAAPAILSSSGTVILGLLTLLLADSPFVSRIGLAGAAGILVAVAFALIVLPAAMSLPGRWLFWPFVPRVGDDDASHQGLWRRVGTAVTARPAVVTVVGLLALTVMALGTFGIKTGLGQDEEFLDTPESISAQETLSAVFPAGAATPTVVAASKEKGEDLASKLGKINGVQSANVSHGNDAITQISITLTDAPGSKKALETIERLRTTAHELDPDSLVGGPDAEALDEATTAASDRLRVVPVVLVVVLLMLMVLLRSVVAAVLLSASTVLSYLSALGVGWIVFDRLLGWSAMDVSTPLLAFIFLVALGVDYNIFLTARAREEMAKTGDAEASIVTALAVTGGVITSAGILLAAVFAVLGVLPLVLLAQLGVLVGFGVLLDTVVVRGVVTPAMVAWCGPHFWWPGRLSRVNDQPHGAHRQRAE